MSEEWVRVGRLYDCRVRVGSGCESEEWVRVGRLYECRIRVRSEE